MVLNQRMRSLRKSHGLLQREVAAVIGVRADLMPKMEAGTHRPKLANLIKLADYYGVSLDYMIGRTDNPEINR